MGQPNKFAYDSIKQVPLNNTCQILRYFKQNS